MLKPQVPIDPAAADYTAGFQPAPLGNTFHTLMFPTFCPSGSADHIARLAGKRRRRTARRLLSNAGVDTETETGAVGAESITPSHRSAGDSSARLGQSEEGWAGASVGLEGDGEDTGSNDDFGPGGDIGSHQHRWGAGLAAGSHRRLLESDRPLTIQHGGSFDGDGPITGPLHYLSANHSGRTRRRDLRTLPPDSDVSLFTGFHRPVDFTSDHIATTASYTACCRFHIGYRCDGSDVAFEGPIVSANFVGLVDETSVWNRGLPAKEVEYALFKMPQGVAARALRANHGVQLDISQGQVHYGRFNNPCTEGPTAAVSGSPGHVANIADHAAGTSGVVDSVTGRPHPTDGADDVVFLNTFGTLHYPWHVRYVYTGVPWAPPLVTGMRGGANVGLDGGSVVTFSGVGFAPSPFLKCALAQTDPNGGHGSDASTHEASGTAVGTSVETSEMLGTFETNFGTYPDPPSLGEYHHYYKAGTAGHMRKNTGVFRFESEPRIALGPGTVVFGHVASSGVALPASVASDWTGLTDPRHRSQSAALAAAWMANTDTRGGKVPPFWQEPNDSRRLGRDVGFFEVMSCVAPAAPAAMAGYYLGASNDGGISSSPTQIDAGGTSAPTATYRELAAVLTGGGASSVAIPALLRAAMGGAFTMAAWVRPAAGESGKGIVLNVGGAGVGFAVHASGHLRGTSSSVGSTVTFGAGAGVDVSVGDWHHIALVVNGAAASAWIDGNVAASSLAMTIAAFPASGPVSVVFSGAGGFGGLVDEVKVWTSALMGSDWMPSAMWDRADVSTPDGARASFPLADVPAPVAYYRFNDFTG